MSRRDCARIVSRSANLAAVNSQFWKTVRIAQHQAATLPCLSRRGIRSTAVKMDEELNIYFTKFGPLYLRRRRRTEEVFGCVQYFTDGVNEGSSVRNALVAFPGCLAQTRKRKRVHSFNELLLTVHFTLRNSS